MAATTDIVGMVVDPGAWETVYVLTPRDGVFRSTDGGDHWTVRNGGLPADRLVSWSHLFEDLLTIDPSSGTTLYANFGGYPYRTTNGGGSWTRLDGTVLTCASGVMVSSVAGITIDRTDPRRLLAGTVVSGCDGGIFEVANVATSTRFTYFAGSGVSGSGLPNDAWHLIQHPSNDVRFYVSSVHGELYSSTDRARTWSGMAPAGLGENTGKLWIDPVSGRLLLAGMVSAWSSIDNGRTWSPVASIAASVSQITHAPSLSSRVYAPSADGLAISNDSGMRFSPPVHGGRSIGSVVVHPTNPDRLYLASNVYGVLASDDGGETVTVRSTDLPSGPVQATELVADPDDPEVLYVAVRDVGIFRSDDGGRTWGVHRYWSALGAGFTLSPAMADRWFSPGLSLFRSTDRGRTWSIVFGVAGTSWEAVAVDRYRPDRVFASGVGAGRIYRSVDGGDNWAPINVSPASLRFADMAFDPRSADHVFTVNGNGVWESSDGGQRWTNLYDPATLGPSGSFASIAIDPANPDRIIVGNRSGGLYLSDDDGSVFRLVRMGRGTVSRAAFGPSGGFWYADQDDVYHVTSSAAGFEVVPLAAMTGPSGFGARVLPHPSDPTRIWALGNDGVPYAYRETRPTTPDGGSEIADGGLGARDGSVADAALGASDANRRDAEGPGDSRVDGGCACSPSQPVSPRLAWMACCFIAAIVFGRRRP